MAIFGQKKKTSVSPKPAAAAAVVRSLPHESHTHVILRPRITEKATVLMESGVYSFEVTDKATKATVAVAVRELYKVTPAKIAIVNLPPKNVIVRGKRGVRSGIRKAYVYLKKGDKIEIV